MINSVNDITMKEETNEVIVGDTKMQITKNITVAFQVHKELKKAEVENLFTMPGVTFEVKRRTVYATKEISSYSEKWSMKDQFQEWDFEEEAGSHIFEKMEALYIEKCHAYAEEYERKWLIEEAARIAKLKEDGLFEEEEEEEEENSEDFVGETKNMIEDNSVNDNDIVAEETKTGETNMINNIFVYEEETNQNVYVDNNNFAFHNGYQIEQETEIYGNKFFNSVLKDVLEEYGMDCEIAGNNLSFKNVLEEEEQEFEETPGYMVLEETKQKIAKIIEGYPVQEIFKIREENETIFQGLIDYYYDY